MKFILLSLIILNTLCAPALAEIIELECRKEIFDEEGNASTTTGPSQPLRFNTTEKTAQFFELDGWAPTALWNEDYIMWSMFDVDPVFGGIYLYSRRTGVLLSDAVGAFELEVIESGNAQMLAGYKKAVVERCVRVF